MMETAPETGAVPSESEKSVPVVTVQQGPRDVEQKRELVKKITDAVVAAYACPVESVAVWIQEVPVDSWGVGGKLAAERG